MKANNPTDSTAPGKMEQEEFLPFMMRNAAPPAKKSVDYYRNTTKLAEIEALASPMSGHRLEDHEMNSNSSSFYNSALQYTFTAVSRDSSFATNSSAVATESLRAVLPKPPPKRMPPPPRRPGEEEDTDDEAHLGSDESSDSDSDTTSELDEAAATIIDKLRGKAPLTSASRSPTSAKSTSPFGKKADDHDRTVSTPKNGGKGEHLSFFRRLIHKSTCGRMTTARTSVANDVPEPVDSPSAAGRNVAGPSTTAASQSFGTAAGDNTSAVNFAMAAGAEPEATPSNGALNRSDSHLKSRRSVLYRALHKHGKPSTSSQPREGSSWKIWRRRNTLNPDPGDTPA